MNDVTIPRNDIHVELHIPDFNIAFDFYSKLGFKTVWRTDPTDDIPGYMVMKRDHTILGFYGGNNSVYDHEYFKKFNKETPRGYGVEIAIFISDIDISDYYKEVIGKIEEKYLATELTLQDYGKRDFRIVDPFGFYIRFSEPENNLYEN
jgi:catechol 2,3-dioxygenase-like lactoylglutathione lyase family enzyme